MEWLDYRINGNPILDWLAAVAVVAGVLLIVASIRRLIAWKLKDSASTETRFDDFIRDLVLRTRLWLVAFIAIAAAVEHLVLDPGVETLIRKLAIFAAAAQLGYWGVAFIDFAIDRFRRRRFQTDPSAVTTISAFGFFGKIAIWLIAILVALDNAGIEITPLIAGLGVGGVAIALATQNILGDLFASLSIVIDKPFVLGDFITVGTEAGTVEKIGLKTTRVRSLSGEQLIFSNNDLLSSRIRNYKRMLERRSLFRFGVLYGSTRGQLEQIPIIVREIVDGIPEARFDRAHFQGFGDSSLDFEVVYWVLVPDYNKYMDIQQQINLELFSRIEALGTGFAFPTRTLYLENQLEPSGGELTAR